MNNNKETKELKEFTELPKRHSRINPTGKPTKYWVAVDEYSDSLNAYSKYVTPNMQLKDVGHNATPPQTVDKKQAVALAKRAIAKFPKWYVFVGQDKSSHGMMTGKDHLRASVLYIWDPVLKLWNDNVDESDEQIKEAASIEITAELQKIIDRLVKKINKLTGEHKIKFEAKDSLFAILRDLNPTQDFKLY